ncbi:MAG: BatA domain-containing protein [Cyclobacteriaceae bacterium]|nr:BatA domain-containing protein [Cyclobacteriaceae bacterium]
MNFTNPQFLYGLIALSIPIIVHLFNFRKTKKVYFSNIRFLHYIKETSRAKRRLKHYLVLASRLLFIFFLVVAFAQPVLPPVEKGLNSKFVSIYLDTSKSMENTANTGIRAFDEALEYVQEVINIYPRGTQFRLITNNFEPFSNSYKSSEKVEDHITELSLNGVDRTFNEAENRRNSLAQAVGNPQEDIYIISDFQESTLGSINEWQVDTSRAYHLLPIYYENTLNLSIDSLYLESPFVLDKDHVTLIAKIRNYGNEEVNNVNLKVFIEDIQVSSTSVSLAGNESKDLTFDVSYNLKNENKARIVVDDYPVTFDDTFFFIINTASRIEVLEIKQDELSTPISKVFGNEDLFNTTSQVITNIDYSLIKTSDLVVVNQIENISTSLSVALAEYIEEDGRLLIIPSEKGEKTQYELLLGSIKLTSVEDATMQELSKPDLDNPFFADVFEEKQITFNMPKAKAIYSWRGRNSNLLKFNLGTPFLSIYDRLGTVFFMASPLIDEFTDFHKHALFVPTMYKIATYKTKNSARSYYLLNESIIKTRLDSLKADKIYKVKQNQTEVIPEQRVAGNELLMQIPKETLESGFASLQFEDMHKMWLAFNYDYRESNLTQISIEDIETYVDRNQNIAVFSTSDAKTFSKEIKARYLGQPLWKFAIILSLIFLLAEILIIRYMR